MRHPRVNVFCVSVWLVRGTQHCRQNTGSAMDNLRSVGFGRECTLACLSEAPVPLFLLRTSAAKHFAVSYVWPCELILGSKAVKV